jgi:hypothetical protein
MDFPLQDGNCRLQVASTGSHENPKRIGGGRDQRWKNHQTRPPTIRERHVGRD